MFKVLIVGIMMFAITGCQSLGGKETVGLLGGAAAGGLVGSQFGGGSGKAIATTVGVFLGGMAGRSIGAQLDAADNRMMQNSFQTALERAPNNTKVQWDNPNTGNAGVTIPTSTRKTAEGKYCREYNHRVKVAGGLHNSYGLACRQPDGSWEIQ